MSARSCSRVGLFVASLVMGAAWARVEAAPVATYHDDVLGTSLELIVDATDEAAAVAAEQAVLDEIDRMASVCSTYDPTSELSRWLEAGECRAVSGALASLLRACDRWRQDSGGAFHPGVAAATRLWREAERNGCPPADERLAAVAVMLRQPPWTWRETDVAPRATAITLDALAKGAIVDAACTAALAVDGVQAVVVNIGGDVAVRGILEREVVVASPDPGLTGGDVLDHVVVTDAALATSGDAFRGFRVAGRYHSHVIDPRTARPADGVRSASVLAPTATDADALATICCVLPPAESMTLVESVRGASCLILDRDGAMHASRDWPGHQFCRRRTIATPVALADRSSGGRGTAFELVLDLEINRPSKSGRYRRPYVAAWVEDPDGFPVKTLLLWVQNGGGRWIPDLKRWYRADRLRKMSEEADLVKSVSEATRQPGKHSVSWDGRDNAGTPLPLGEYTICLEAAREHGTYQFDRRTVTLGEKPFREAFDDGAEIKSATLTYDAVDRKQ